MGGGRRGWGSEEMVGMGGGGMSGWGQIVLSTNFQERESQADKFAKSTTVVK